MVGWLRAVLCCTCASSARPCAPADLRVIADEPTYRPPIYFGSVGGRYTCPARRSRRFAMSDVSDPSFPSRRGFIRAGLGAAGTLALPGLSSPAFADDHAGPIGTWPAGV